jgi:hypothetical protein
MINHAAKQVHITELFFMAREGKIWCSGLSRLSSVNTPTYILYGKRRVCLGFCGGALYASRLGL